MTRRLVSINGAPYFRDEEGAWISLHLWKRLAEVSEIFDEMLVIMPEIDNSERPEGWVKITTEARFEGMCRTSDNKLVRQFKSMRKLRELLRSDDVLLAAIPSPEGYWAYRAAREKGIPFISEIVGEPESSVMEEDGRDILRNLTRRFRAARAKSQSAEACRNAACVVSVGPALAEQYVPSNVPCLVSTVHLLEEEHYSPRTDFTLSDPPVLLFVGQIQRRKGLDYLFEALAGMHDRGRNFRMVLIGKGPLEPSLRAYAVQHGFAEKVDFTGYTAHGGGLFESFKEADLFVLPSVAAEGVPRVTHEAMAFGCPVVGADIGSTAWQLRDGAGIVVPPRDIHALTEAIESVLESEELRRELSEKGYARSLEHTFERQKAEKLDFLRAQLGL